MRAVAADPAVVAAGAAALAAAEQADPGCWLVGGAVRDVLRGGAIVKDLDLTTSGDPRGIARAVAERLEAPMFALSDRFGGYRVTAAGGLQIDVMPLAGASLDDDLARRDFTVNALAAPVTAAAASWPAVARADVIDRCGGIADLSRSTLRAVGATALLDDPLRVLRAARMVAGGQWRLDGALAPLARAAAPGLREVAAERSGAELRLLLGAPLPLRGLEAMRDLGATAALIPELDALVGVVQSPYHHRDVGGHTAEVLAAQIELETRLSSYVDERSAAAWEASLDDDLGGEWTRRQTLRLAALLHDIAKPQTRTFYPERGMVGFPDHDRQGQRLSGEILRRLRVPRRVTDTVGAITRHHLRLGYLVHAAPLDAGQVFDYLAACEPVEVEVTVLALADRLATRGRGAERAITAHARLTRELLPAALAWRAAGGAPAPLIDGNQLVAELGRDPGPWLAAALAAQRRARYVDPSLPRERLLELAIDAGAEG